MTRGCPKSLLRCSFFSLILPIKGLSAPLASRFKPPVVVLPSSFSHFQSISWSLYCSRRNYSLLLPPLYMRPLFHSDRYILSFPHHIPNSPIQKSSFYNSFCALCAFYLLKEAARVLLFGKRVGVPSAGRNY